MRVLVVGASGLVGTHLVRAFRRASHDVVGTYATHPVDGLVPLELGESKAVRQLISAQRPDVCLITAAWTDVDGCEGNPAAAKERNETQLANVLSVLAEVGSRPVFFSTDYVFDGQAGPYDETDPVGPLNEYGRGKLRGEAMVLAQGGLVLRTTVVFDVDPQYSKNFLLRVLGTLRAARTIDVPMDQWGNPTSATLLAELCRRLCEAGATGVYHAAGPDLMRRSDFAHLIAEVFGLPGHLIRPVPTSVLRQRASRPLRSGFLTAKVERKLAIPLPSTREMLEEVRSREPVIRG